MLFHVLAASHSGLFQQSNDFISPSCSSPSEPALAIFTQAIPWATLKGIFKEKALFASYLTRKIKERVICPGQNP